MNVYVPMCVVCKLVDHKLNAGYLPVSSSSIAIHLNF